MAKYNLRAECINKYGEDFGKAYDTLNSGGAIGDFVETACFIKMIGEVKAECEEKYSFKNRIKRLFSKVFAMEKN